MYVSQFSAHQATFVSCFFSLLQEELEGNVTTVLYILVIITKLMKLCTKKEEFRVYCLVFRLNQLHVAMRDGQTLLHLCVSADTPVDDFHTNDVCK